MSANERFEFITVTASAYDAATLATKLTAHSAQGWEVVSIVTSGSELTAFCRRPATGESPAASSTSSSSSSLGYSSTVPDPTPPVARVETPAAAPRSASSTPAGWYADPSKRYELRYWDGDAWTEHVARSGQQYTDPPVA